MLQGAGFTTSMREAKQTESGAGHPDRDGHGVHVEGFRQLEESFEHSWQRLLGSDFRWDAELALALRRSLERLDLHRLEIAAPPLARKLRELGTHIGVCLGAGQGVHEPELKRLRTLMEQARLQLAQSRADAEAAADRRPRCDEVFTVGADPGQHLATRLHDAGYQVRHLPDAGSVRHALASLLPRAMVVALDEDGAEARTGISLVHKCLAGRIDVPVVFLGRSEQLQVRLAAVQAGGVAFFNQPADLDAVVAKLASAMMDQETGERGRILMVGDGHAWWERLQPVMAGHGLALRRCETMKVLEELQRYTPELVLVDLDADAPLATPDLAAVIRQHHIGYAIPIILLCRQAGFPGLVGRLGAAADDLLPDSVPDEFVLWVIERRLQRSRTINNRLALLNRQDAGTGLFNRRHFLARLERALAGHSKSDRPLAVVLVMLENWRSLRNQIDQPAIDELLRSVARNMRQYLDEADDFARVGDAVFAALVRAVDADALLHSGERLRKAVATIPVGGASTPLALEVRVGIGVARAGDTDARHVMGRADVALNASMVKGARAVQLSDESIGNNGVEAFEARLLGRVSEAVRHERMRLVFQPIVSLRGGAGRRYEVLLRMYDEDGTELMAESVFSLAHRNSRLGLALDRWVMSHAVNALRGVHEEDLILFVHISDATLSESEPVDWLSGRVPAGSVPPGALVFEVTEAAARRSPRQIAQLATRIHDHGWQLAITRFGLESDSPSLIDRLAPDYVKLDRLFVRDLTGPKQAEARAALREMVQRLNDRGARPIISGVENMQILPALWSAGADLVQGYFLQRPDHEMNYDFAGLSF